MRLAPLYGARALGTGPLRLAIPRGALYERTLDLLDRVGIATSGLRTESRALAFDCGELTVITMRPSDVPTYVEAGAADVGITGKDVLLEQAGREVYELLDLGYGNCRMIVAARDGSDPFGEGFRRRGMVRIATKYPRIASEYFAATGGSAPARAPPLHSPDCPRGRPGPAAPLRGRRARAGRAGRYGDRLAAAHAAHANAHRPGRRAGPGRPDAGGYADLSL